MTTPLGNIKTSGDFPPIPTRKFDWSAWIDGREDWRIGHGATEAEAVNALWTELWENGDLDDPALV